MLAYACQHSQDRLNMAKNKNKNKTRHVGVNLLTQIENQLSYALVWDK
jgi:hypothetical protein